MPGPPKKPTALKRLAGNPGGKALPPDEPKPDPYAGPPPPELRPDALEFWIRMAPKLQAGGVFTEFDTDKFHGAAVAYGRWIEATREVDKVGEIVKTALGNVIQNPWLSVANRAYEQWTKALGEFGMSPADRVRVSVEKRETVDALDELMAQRNKNRAKAQAAAKAKPKRKGK